MEALGVWIVPASGLNDPVVRLSGFENAPKDLTAHGRNRGAPVKPPTWPDPSERAFLSGGTSETAIYEMVAEALRHSGVTSGIMLDVGCGSGNLYSFVRDRLSSYVGVDLVRYEGFPTGADWVEANLEQLPLPLPAAFADV